MNAEHARPLGEAEFAGLIEACGPFERSPLIAVATSGGADSLALALLAHDWAVRRGGRAVGLIVDHALRPESASESAEVAAWLGAAGIEPVVLRWDGPRPHSGVQAAARGARYALLEAWCREAGVLHLLLGHQQDDQAETVLMRRRRRVGPGVAGMAATIEAREVRMTRPFLDVPHARLVASLRARGQRWIEDPSNQDRRFERVRVRGQLPRFAARGWRAERIIGHAAEHAAGRRDLERRAVDLLGKAARVHPMGFVVLDRPTLLGATQEERTKVFARALVVAGGGAYPPSAEACARLADGLAAGAARRTLGGCVVVARPGFWLVAREERAARAAIPLAASPIHWDNRFVLTWQGPDGPDIVVRRLGRDGWRQVRGFAKPGVSVPVEALWALPALWRLDEVVGVPHLNIGRVPWSVVVRFRPRQLLMSPHLGLGGRNSGEARTAEGSWPAPAGVLRCPKRAAARLAAGSELYARTT